MKNNKIHTSDRHRTYTSNSLKQMEIYSLMFSFRLHVYLVQKKNNNTQYDSPVRGIFFFQTRC